MRLIEIKTLENGSHRNQTTNTTMSLPEGWAVIPEDMETPNFPFGEVEVKDEDVMGVTTIEVVEEINGESITKIEEIEVVVGTIKVVTKWTPGTLPEPKPLPEAEPTAEDDIDAMLVDHEYRLTLLELGVTQ